MALCDSFLAAALMMTGFSFGFSSGFSLPLSRLLAHEWHRVSAEQEPETIEHYNHRAPLMRKHTDREWQPGGN